jgi:NAD(P)-dependent dehydrogenase (short-subunit alcohol dehydrogenase family)
MMLRMARRNRRGEVRGLLRDAGGLVSGSVPDGALKVARRARGRSSLARAVGRSNVMITGASSGVGRATALKVGAAGGTVLLVARSADKLEQTRAQIERAGGRAHVHACDLCDVDAVDGMAAEALERHGRVDMLVHNAVRSGRRPVALSHHRFDDFERPMQVNYFGPVALILALLPSMRARGFGRIVNASSNTPRSSGYVASKAALDAFSRCAAPEIVDDGVSITTVHMPAIAPERAAGLLAEAIIHHPKRVASRSRR